MTGNPPSESFSVIYPFALSNVYQNIYFQEHKKQKKLNKKREISVANLTGNDEIVCEFALCTFTYWIES